MEQWAALWNTFLKSTTKLVFLNTIAIAPSYRILIIIMHTIAVPRNMPHHQANRLQSKNRGASHSQCLQQSPKMKWKMLQS